MSLLQQHDDGDSGNQPAKAIGALSRRTPTFDTGARKSLREILKKIRVWHNTYKYAEIAVHDDIRLLKILHGKKDDPLKCMLFPCALPSTGKRSKSQIHKFWALSYWWGEDEPTHPITMYDDTRVREGLQTMTPFNPSGVFYVRDNLAAALMQFRREDEDVNIWCDAVCINQSDVKEKTAQVARMHEIYSEAEYVCVWLGAGNDETKDTFDFLRSLLDLQHLDKVSQLRNSQSRREWLLVVKLMKNRWFSRRWVIQELVLARKATVRWGSEEMQWSNFADAIALLMTKHHEIKEIIGTTASFSTRQDPDAHVGALDPRALGATTLVDATSSLFRRAEDGKVQQRLVNLETLVSSQFLAFEASEPRDTIYAVLSLAKDTTDRSDLVHQPSFYIPPKSSLWDEVAMAIWYSCYMIFRWVWVWVTLFRSAPTISEHKSHIDKRIAPDYDKSLTDVCSDFIEYCIDTSHSLDILCRHWAPRPKPLTPRQKLELSDGEVFEEETMPSWIPSIEGHAYGGPRGVLDGRTNGDSLVGGLNRQNKQHYSASGNLRPYVKFGKHKTPGSDKKHSTEKREPNVVSPVGMLDTGTSHQPPTRKVQVPSSVPRKFDGTMFVKGRQLGIIEKITGRVLQGVIPAEAFEYGGWPAISSGGRIPDEVPDQLWRTLVADRGPNGINAPTWYRRACLECLHHVNANGDLNTNEFKNFHDTPATMKMFLERVQNVIWSRKFFLCKAMNGAPRLYGLAPPKTANGDIVCILFGCSVPVVLRKSQTNNSTNDKYTFVGECYVHGMMDGEALPKKMPEYPYTKSRGFVLI